MAQYIKNASLFGRIGTNLGKGLAEQLPKEVERGRLAAGLKNLSEKEGQTPFQQFSELSAIPGVTPQMIQSGSDLLRQQARGKALSDYQSNQNQPKPNPFSQEQSQRSGRQGEKPPSITQEKPLAEIQEGAIPPTREEEFARAGQIYKEYPERFGNDPQKAIDFVASETERNQAYQQKHANLNVIQDNVVSRLNNQYKKLSGDNPRIPSELYSQIEDEAIKATKSKKEGGEGLTEQQAMKKYGDKLIDADRDFSKIDEIGNWGITLRSAGETLRSMKDLQNKMEKLNQTDNFAKNLISRNKLSPKLAYAIAEPVSRVPELGQTIRNLPALEQVKKSIALPKVPLGVSIPKTLEIAPRLAQLVKNNEKASPLAIAHEIEKKGYDAKTWLQYITDHANELNLRQRQSEQSSTPINAVSPWNDWWLQSFSGLD
jgi:hypothetical protein